MAHFIFRSNRKTVEEQVQKTLETGMKAIAAQAEGNAKREITTLVYDTPPSPTYVRTGALRNSITHDYKRDEMAAYVGTDIEYAPYVEFGTVRMPERPFLRRAVLNYVKEYQTLLTDALRNLS